MRKTKPIAYTANALTKSQKNYSQLEKEAFAIMVASKKFHQYIWGNKDVIVESDHKPLDNIFKKPLVEALVSLQRILFEIMQYNVKLICKKGTDLHIADALCRDCRLEEPSSNEIENELQVCVIVPVSLEK